MKRWQFATAVAVAIGLLQSAAWAWQSSVEEDAFTGDSVEYIQLQGEILAGEEGVTSLIIRRSESNGTELVWASPHRYICEASIDLRFGENEPEEAIASLSTSNTSVIFTHPWYVLSQMVRYEQLLIRLSDHCGNHSVARFTGSPLQNLPELSILSEGSGWSMNRHGYLLREGENIQLSFVRNSNGRPDLAVYVSPPGLRGQPLPRRQSRAILTVGAEIYRVDTLYLSVFSSSEPRSNGRVLLLIRDLDFNEILAALEANPTMQVEFEGRTYWLDLSGYEIAFQLG